MVNERSTLLQNIGRGLTVNTLKYIAILAMVIDHIAYAFVSSVTALSIVLHFIGRTTGPICFSLRWRAITIQAIFANIYSGLP